MASIPQAHVVRQSGQLVAPPPAPKSPPGPLRQHLYVALQVAFGLWPLTAVVLLVFGLMYYAAMNGSP